MKHTIGLGLAAVGTFLVYEAWTGSGGKAAPNFAKPGPLDPGQPPIVGIPPSIMPSGYADCITNGGKWNLDTGSCIYAG